MPMSVRQIADFFAENGVLPEEEFEKKLDDLNAIDLENLREFIAIHCTISKLSFEHGYKAGAEDFKNWLQQKYKVEA